MPASSRSMARQVQIQTVHLCPVPLLQGCTASPPSPDPISHLSPHTSSVLTWAQGELKSHHQLLSSSNHCPVRLVGPTASAAGTPQVPVDTLSALQCPVSKNGPLSSLPTTLPLSPAASTARHASRREAGSAFCHPASLCPRLHEAEYDEECVIPLGCSQTSQHCTAEAPRAHPGHSQRSRGTNQASDLQSTEARRLARARNRRHAGKKHSSKTNRVEGGNRSQGRTGAGALEEGSLEHCHVPSASIEAASPGGSQQNRVPRMPVGGTPDCMSPCTPGIQRASTTQSPLGPRAPVRTMTSVSECGDASPSSSPARLLHNRSLSSVSGTSPLHRYQLLSSRPVSDSFSTSPMRTGYNRTNNGLGNCPWSSPLRSSSAASPISPLSGGWVDPNELHIDLSKVARHRHRRSGSNASNGSLTSPPSDGHDAYNVGDKKAQRAERHRRIQSLLRELSGDQKASDGANSPAVEEHLPTAGL